MNKLDRAVLVATQKAMQLHDMMPDVGMGPDYMTVLNCTLQEIGLEREDINYEAILDHLRA